MATILENAITLLPGRPYRFERRNILIVENKISAVSKSKIHHSSAQKIDCTKKIVIPGLINAHTHAPMSILRGHGDDLPLHDWLSKHMWPKEKKLGANDIYAGTMLSIAQMFTSGITCFNDNYFHISAIAKAAKETNIRATLGYSMIDLGDFDGKGQSELKQAQKDAKEISQDKTGLLTPSINPHAPNTCSKELLQESASLAKKLNLKLHIHACETKSELAFTKKKFNSTPISILEKTGCLTKNSILAHAIYCNPADILLIKKSGASIAHCPIANMKLGSGSFTPITKYIANHTNVCLGTDGPASNNSLSMFETAKMAALLQKNHLENPAAAKADDYLFMALEGGAKALGINAGKIAPGALADLAFLNADSPELIPFSNNAGWLLYSAGAQNISDLMVNGKWVMKNKTILTFDVQKVMQNAQKISDSLN
ncbi:MAG: amidohydrolase [Candidatus Micrarchaeia archaeon]